MKWLQGSLSQVKTTSVIGFVLFESVPKDLNKKFANKKPKIKTHVIPQYKNYLPNLVILNMLVKVIKIVQYH